MNPISIISKEMEDQVGLYDEGDEFQNPGVVNDITSKGCKRRFYCGFSKKHKLPFNYPSIAKERSKSEWKLCAEAIIDELTLNEYNFELDTLNSNGFTLEETNE